MQKKHLMQYLLLVALTVSFSVSGSSQPESFRHGLVSTTMAKTWEEGLISGNGTIGANVLGNPSNEIIIFTHERMFLPEAEPMTPPDQSSHLFEIRRLIDQGNYREATELQFKYSKQDGFRYPDPFVPVCDMNILMDNPGGVKNYRRSLNFETGESTISWSNDNGAYERKLFVSRADGVAVLKIKADKKGGLDCIVRFNRRCLSPYLSYKYLESSYEAASRQLKDVKMEAHDHFLSYSHAFQHAYPGSIQSVEGLALVNVEGGTCKAEKNVQFAVNGADEIVLLIDIEPNYSMMDSNLGKMKDKLNGIKYSYSELLARHAQIHGEMFNRVSLDLGGGSDHSLTTEELFRKSSNENINAALMEKEFDAGRYNIISSTGQLPPVLQGLWAGTYSPDWASDYTHNGNVPSAIASMLMGNYPELMLAYVSYIESIVPWLEINAKHLFGCRGIVLPSRSTTNGYNNALAGTFAGGFWLAGAAWAAHFFYDYYLYTGDREFLKNRALPYMEKAALFFEDFLYTGPDGKYIFSPTQSPENTPSNINSQGTFNSTMDVAAAKELLHNIISASKTLKTNKEKIPVWENMLAKMPEYMIDKNGMFKEWLTPKLENNDNHRHSSQLYPLYDNFPEEFANDPKLVEAVRNSVNYKLEKHWKGSGSGFMSFGLVQLGLVGASIGDKEIVHESLKHMVNRFWLENMASMHNHKSLFNMDISGGMPAVIIKMLVYSDPGLIKILPALPDVWSDKGEIDGVLCRGQIEVNKLKWNRTDAEVTLTSQINQKIKVVSGSESKNVSLKAGQPYTMTLKR